jgi:hypothetical protein
VNGVEDLPGSLAAITGFTMDGRAADIRCEMLNRWLVVQHVLDWLDDTLNRHV